MSDNKKPARSYRMLGDVWFALLPIWSAPVGWFFIVQSLTKTRLSFEDEPFLFFMLFQAVTYMGLSTFWCCWKLDATTQSREKLKWYCVVLFLMPLGATICYFWKLREATE